MLSSIRKSASPRPAFQALAERCVRGVFGMRVRGVFRAEASQMRFKNVSDGASDPWVALRSDSLQGPSRRTNQAMNFSIEMLRLKSKKILW